MVNTPTVGDIGQVRFTQNMSLTGNGTTPVLNWTFPPDALRENVRLRIYDHQRLSLFGFPDIAHDVVLASNQTTYQIPAVLGDGSNINIGDRYTVGIFGEETRDDGSLRARSRSFFEFVAVDAGTTPIFLPSVGPDGVYHFDLTVVGGLPVVIDPQIAIGYDYAIGPGDPFFTSVLLPDIGDGLFDLWLFDTAGDPFDTLIDVGQGMVFDFTTQLVGFQSDLGYDPSSGIDRFRILGIEPGALIDPSDTTAFMTTLTFADDGEFTGTMTPITTSVPEPPTLAVFLVGLTGLGVLVLVRRRTGVA